MLLWVDRKSSRQLEIKDALLSLGTLLILGDSRLENSLILTAENLSLFVCVDWKVDKAFWCLKFAGLDIVKKFLLDVNLGLFLDLIVEEDIEVLFNK